VINDKVLEKEQWYLYSAYHLALLKLLPL